METIQVTPDRSLTFAQVVEACREAAESNIEITDQVAGRIASYWQSSGTTGSVLAALASGVTVSVADLNKDISDTIWEEYAEAPLDDKLMLDMLGTWGIRLRRRVEETDNHVILVAFDVPATSRKHAQELLLPSIQPALSSHPDRGPAESWWVAEDDRIDGSDCDSAVFVPMGTQEMVSRTLARNALTTENNIVERES